MESLEAKQSEQGQVSALGESPKDEKQTKTERRTFLKRAGIATTGLCAPGLPKVAAAKTEEPDKSLNEEIAQLDPEEKAALVTFLKGLWEIDRMLSPSLVKCYLNITQAIVERQERTAKEEKAKQKERKHRDSLTGQAKVDFVLEKLRTEDIGLYRASFQREFLELIRDDKPIPSEEHYQFKAKVINERFEGCSKSFRRKVIDQYLTTVLPEMEAEQQKEDAEQEAYDNLLNSLSNKTTAEVVALTKQLKRAGTGKGVSI